MLQRAVSLHLADSVGIPDPSEAEFALFLRDIPRFVDPQTGLFSRDQYTATIDEFQNNPDLGQETLIRVLIQDYRIHKVANALAGPGYILPYMALTELEQRNTVWAIDVANLQRDSFQPEIDANSEALATFFQENSFRYESGPRIVLSYVLFPSENYLDEVTEPTNTQLTTHYAANRATWAKDESGVTLPLDDVRDQVVASWKQEQARNLAAAAANQLAVETYEAIYEKKLSHTPESIAAFLQGKNLEAVSLQPFPRENPPSIAGLPRQALAQAAELTPRRFYTDGVPVTRGAVVFYLEEELPSQLPAFAEVQERVTADYTRDEKQRLFNLHAMELKKQLEAAVAEGTSFTEAAQSLDLEVKSYADFTLMSPPEGVDYFTLATLQNMQQGEISDLMAYGDLGTFVYVGSKSVPDYNIDSTEVTETMRDLSGFVSQLTAQSIMTELIVIGEKQAVPTEL